MDKRKRRMEDDNNDEDVHLLSPSSAPLWVEERVREYHGSELRFVATKLLKSSDLSSRQNRLRIPTKNVHAALRPLLSDSELEEANLLHPIQNGSAGKTMTMTTSGEAGTRERRVGRKHDGLEVSVFTRANWRFGLYLSCWDSTGATILKGDEWQKFRVFSGIQVGDVVDMWCFREGPERKLCFIIAKTMAIVIAS